MDEVTYSSLDEIYEDKAEVLEEIDATLTPLTPSQLAYRPLPGAWSIAEIAEHLSIVETGQLRMLRVLTEKAEAGGKRPAPVSITLDERFRDSAAGKIKARQQNEPTGAVAAADSLANLLTIQTGLGELRPRLERVDVASVTFAHPVLGDLSLGQWLAFVGMHEERHLRQMRGVMASPGFPRT
ncbi:MAG TPA: DinB family protein [Bacteroidota bacterium]|nr:DinB family protein [Bacteroidota bacterium]